MATPRFFRTVRGASVAKQRGFSFWNMMIYIAFFGSVILLGMKMIPAYLESIKIDNALLALERDGFSGMSRRDIKKALVTQFDIDEVNAIAFRDFDDHVIITKAGDSTIIEVFYEKEIPLIANAKLLLSFDKSVQQ